MSSIENVSAINAPTKKSNSDIDNNLAEFLGNEDYSEVDMGQIDEEELPFMIIDKDTGKVYDIRNDKHVERLSCANTASFRQDYRQTEDGSRQSAWGDWWKMKKKND